MTTKHTSGPWRAKHSAKLGWAGVLTQEGDIIADISMVAEDFRDPEQALADARLIAAAPDLLAALKRLVRCVSHMDENPAMVNAHAVIEKATKEKP